MGPVKLLVIFVVFALLVLSVALMIVGMFWEAGIIDALLLMLFLVPASMVHPRDVLWGRWLNTHAKRRDREVMQCLLVLALLYTVSVMTWIEGLTGGVVVLAIAGAVIGLTHSFFARSDQFGGGKSW